MLKKRGQSWLVLLLFGVIGLVPVGGVMRNQLDGIWILNIRRSSFASRTWSCRKPQVGSRTIPGLLTWMPKPAP